jgi:hypothetical protein
MSHSPSRASTTATASPPADWLREALTRERQVSGAFTELPYHYAQVATLLLAA